MESAYRLVKGLQIILGAETMFVKAYNQFACLSATTPKVTVGGTSPTVYPGVYGPNADLVRHFGKD